MDGGEKIPVTYAVVEADSVLTSNDWSGRAVDGYGDDPTRVHAVAGNGRLAGLNEAFERGTATQYVADMMADRQQTGINPEAVGDLKRPVLVRFMPSEKVKTVMFKRSHLGEYYIIVTTDAVGNTYGKSHNGASVGIDFGLKTYMTMSDGTIIESPRFVVRIRFPLSSPFEGRVRNLRASKQCLR